jgi:ATP-dependent helicase/nuclease subunit A
MNTLTSHQLAALKYDSHISLTANAGSGKTFVLSKRYIEIALADDASLRRIAAITFTDKAAGELYKKIAEQVEERLSQAADENLVKKLEKIRRNLVSANISTIHSFCIDILREHPVEAELDANFTPIDQQTSDEMIELSVEELIKEELKKDEENLKYLIRIFSSKSLLAKELISLIKNRKNVLTIAAKIYSRPAEETAELFKKSFEDFSEKILVDITIKFFENLLKINDEILSDNSSAELAKEISGLLSEIRSMEVLSAQIPLIINLKDRVCTKTGTIKIKGYLKKDIREIVGSECDFVEKYFKDIEQFYSPENSREAELELAKFGNITIEFFNKALLKYEQKKRESGYLDFEDILLITQKILTNENIKQSLSDRYTYIMIDEYQDTNELQYQIFLPLLDHLKKGNLFVVGDEKQSIYMFRDAELQVFDRTKKEIALSSGDKSLLSLPDSFRMAPKLCLFTNKLFENLFTEPNILFNEVEHSDLVCARDSDVKGEVEILLAECTSEKESTEADLVSKKILSLINENKFNFKDAAVLCRKRKSFAELERSFIQFKIPFVIVGGKGFYQRQPVYDIYNYFSFLLNEEDDTALIGILRSPFFTIPDTEIFEILLQPEKKFWKKLQSFASKNEKFKNIVKILSDNLSLASSHDVTFLMRKILTESNYTAVLAAKAEAVQEIANIDKLIRVSNNFKSQDFKTLYDYVEFLKTSIEQIEDESQAAVSDDSNAVKIMTLHQAKGLEYPAVFLFSCSDPISKDSIKSKSITLSKDFGLLTKVPLNEDYFSEYQSAPIVGIHNYISEKKNLAEVKRLFYVGVTRAKDYLCISAEAKETEKYNANSFIGLLRDGLNFQFNGESETISGRLEYLKKKDEIFENYSEILSIDIPIIKTLPDIFPADAEADEAVRKNLNEKIIIDIPEGEIISATKVAVYSQCPLKYQLTYEHGFGPLLAGYKNFNKNEINYDYNPAEDSAIERNEESPENYLRKYSDLKGRIIHKILQKNIPQPELDNAVREMLKEELSQIELEKIGEENLKKDILFDLNNFYSSDQYALLKNYKNYKNEFEIYVKEGDYYLYGIVDKLIVEKNKIIIVDYKTDNIPAGEIAERCDNYLTQLKFYSYIVSRLYENINEFELRLIFIKHPNMPVIKNLDKHEFADFRRQVEGMVEDIREKKFNKNLSHCKKCLYSINNYKCIIS